MRLKERKRLFTGKQSNRPKKHCKDDIACEHCCQCWLKYQKQYQIRYKNIQEKLQSQKKQNAFLSGLNQDLTNKLSKYKETAKALENMEAFKQGIKAESKQQLKKQLEVEWLMKQQLISELTAHNEDMANTIKQYQKIKAVLENEVQQKVSYIQSIQHINAERQTRIQELESELSQTDQRLNTAIIRIRQLENSIQTKTELISRMQKACNQTGDHLTRQKNKSSNLQFDRRVLESKTKYQQGQVSQLNRLVQKSQQNINNLHRDNIELNVLLATMRHQLQQNRITQDYLKDRLVQAQSLADYNANKIQMMKSDLELMKINL